VSVLPAALGPYSVVPARAGEPLGLRSPSFVVIGLTNGPGFELATEAD
jgi:hypothetical protein